MLVIRNLNEDNSFNRVDILGLSKDDFYLIERGVESLLKTQDGYNPDKVCSLLRNLNDNGTFLLNNENNIPMYSQQEVNNEFVDLGLPSGTRPPSHGTCASILGFRACTTTTDTMGSRCAGCAKNKTKNNILNTSALDNTVKS